MNVFIPFIIKNITNWISQQAKRKKMTAKKIARAKVLRWTIFFVCITHILEKKKWFIIAKELINYKLNKSKYKRFIFILSYHKFGFFILFFCLNAACEDKRKTKTKRSWIKNWNENNAKFGKTFFKKKQKRFIFSIFCCGTTTEPLLTLVAFVLCCFPL